MLVAIGRKPFTRRPGPGDASASPSTSAASSPTITCAPMSKASTSSATAPPGRCWRTRPKRRASRRRRSIAGQWGHVNYDVIPNVIYTDPEVATVGKIGGRAEGGGRGVQGRQVPVHGQFARAHQSRDRRHGEGAGGDARRRRWSACTWWARASARSIGEVCVAMEFGASAEDIARTCHAHPTMSEAIREAAKGVDGWTMQA